MQENNYISDIKKLLAPVKEHLFKEDSEQLKNNDSVGGLVLQKFCTKIPYDEYLSISLLHYLKDIKSLDVDNIISIFRKNYLDDFRKNTDTNLNDLCVHRLANCRQLSQIALGMLRNHQMTGHPLTLVQMDYELGRDYNKEHVFCVYNSEGKDLDYILKNPKDKNNIAVDLWMRKTCSLAEMIDVCKDVFQLNSEKEAAFIFDNKYERAWLGYPEDMARANKIYVCGKFPNVEHAEINPPKKLRYPETWIELSGRLLHPSKKWEL